MYSQFAYWYDKMMHTVNYDRWADYISCFLDSYRCRSVYESSCGTGNITVRLAKKGFSVIASDISTDMLMVTRQKMMRAGFRFPVIQQDMRAIHAHRPVDAVISVCDGVNYLTDSPDAFFSRAYDTLAPGGLLLFDISSDYKLSHQLNNTSFSDIGDDWAYICECEYDAHTSLLDMDLTCFVKDGAHYARFEEQHKQKAYTIQAIEDMLIDAHFCNIACYECFTMNKPNKNSERIQFVATKPIVNRSIL